MEFWVAAGAWVAAWSLLAFIVCAADKRRARLGGPRFSEATLLGLAALGGSPGLGLGIVIARHKTRKTSFLLAFLLILIVQAGILYLVVNPTAL